MITQKDPQQMQLKLLQKSNSKTTEATGDLTGNKIANKIVKVSKVPSQNNSETVTSDIDYIKKDIYP